MPDEKLEFSMQDLGRLGEAIGEVKAIVNWVLLHATDVASGQEAARKVFEGYLDAVDRLREGMKR